jgi:hypothetical protein
MKILLSVLLAALMAWTPIHVQAQTNNVPATSSQKDKENDLWLCLLVVGGTLTGGVLIIWVTSNSCNGSCSNKKLVLESDSYNDNWQPIATNIVGNVCTNRYEVFRTCPRDAGRRYRVKVYPLE